MKKVILFAIIVITFISCDDEVNPKADFSESFSLNCIIRSDTSYQTATITRSYNIDGFDPYTNKQDPFVKGAKIKIYYDNVVYTMRDTSIIRTDTSRYKTPLNFYYTNNFNPDRSLPIKIEATLPNGKVLYANGEVIALHTVYLFSSTTSLPAITNSRLVNFNWGELNVSAKSQGVYYAPELVIFYTHEKDGIKKELQKKVPLYYLPGSPDPIPIYPQIQSQIFSTSFEMEAIDKAMTEIAGDDPNKSNYKIKNALFRLLVMDEGLAIYYSVQKTYLDEFSIRVNQPDITNIKGGLGVFGSYSIKQLSLDIQEQYVKSFGYRK